MANMSYCRFENTLGDLRDCVNVLEDGYDFEDIGLSDSEEQAMHRMRLLCEDFVNAYDRLQEMSMETAE